MFRAQSWSHDVDWFQSDVDKYDMDNDNYNDF